MRHVVVVAVVMLGCGASGGETEHEGSAEAIPEAWRACEADADCDRVAIACCDCGQGDYVGVNQRFVHEAREAAHPTDCERCPQQDCPPNDAVCRAGRCEVVDR
jgi:hypothetical protein